ncbi:hypothetical protein FA15DRAFT_668197 [Coprinopsis marcescibilis]|uniref:CHCH domain-containing protein n=1 Tax=Coprinopsis marcescibilis TaxID=230819 RepID=A0A5C3KZ28_COPMA|nr:hypothetical protein FA15DRAFT_668197 [Coprinopsis marcescibilis]
MTTLNAASKPTRPIQRLAFHSTVTCATQATTYGKCVAATYTDVRKDSCREEFLKFKDCLREAMKKR